MLLTELVSLIKDLPYSDKLLLVHYLSTELLQESGLALLETHTGSGSQGLYDSFEAAAVLAEALAEEKTAKHG